MHLDRLIKKSELTEFETLLQAHQKVPVVTNIVGIMMMAILMRKFSPTVTRRR